MRESYFKTETDPETSQIIPANTWHIFWKIPNHLETVTPKSSQADAQQLGPLKTIYIEWVLAINLLVLA